MKAVGGQRAFKLEGIPELKKTLTEVRKSLSAEGNKALSDQLQQGMLIAADMIAREAKDLVPVRTGNLKRAIVSGIGRGAAVYAAVLLSKAPYARYVEKGTSKQPANPYFRPAVAAVRPSLARILSEKVGPVVSAAAELYAWKAPS